MIGLKDQVVGGIKVTRGFNEGNPGLSAGVGRREGEGQLAPNQGESVTRNALLHCGSSDL